MCGSAQAVWFSDRREVDSDPNGAFTVDASLAQGVCSLTARKAESESPKVDSFNIGDGGHFFHSACVKDDLKIPILPIQWCSP